jgi:hypothetical protein
MTHTISLYYFPKGLRYTSPLILAVAGYLLYDGFRVWGLLLLVVTIFILTAKYITAIGKNEFTDAFGVFGLAVVTEKKHFSQLNKIVITKGSYSQMVNTRASSRQLDWTDYTGTLIYDGTQSLDLVTTDDKDQLLNELRVYATSLGVAIEDPTGRQIFSPF